MLFQIRRVSDWADREKPCENSFRMQLDLESSTTSVWGIEINSPEELMALEESVGHPLILSESYIDNKTPCIAIYDDYIE